MVGAKNATWKKLKFAIAVFLTVNSKVQKLCRKDIDDLGVKIRFFQFPEEKLCILEDEWIFR